LVARVNVELTVVITENENIEGEDVAEDEENNLE